MDRDDVWRAIDDQRRRLAGLLEDLSEQEWQHPSLCRGWTVRQVAAHIALQNTTWSMMPRAVLDMIRSGGMNGAIHAMACFLVLAISGSWRPGGAAGRAT
jgi:Mycothiol maleylpyruvate isomerase N-terminal domain